MKIHKQKEKVSVVMNPEELFQIGIALSESPRLEHRKLALKLTEAMKKEEK